MFFVAFVSCKKDKPSGDNSGGGPEPAKCMISKIHSDNGNGKVLDEIWTWHDNKLKKIDHYSNGSVSWSEEYSYNGNGQLARVDDYKYDEYCEYKYDGDKLSKAQYYSDGLLYEEYNFKYNSDNKISEVEIQSHDYYEEWLYYDDGYNVDAIGGPELFYWGVMFPSYDISEYEDTYLTKVSLFDYAYSTGNIYIYYGGSSSPGELVHTQSYVTTGKGYYTEFDLTKTLPINTSKNIWVVFSTTNGENYPAACCDNTYDHNGRWISLDGYTWEDLYYDYDFSNTWMIRAFVSSFAKGDVVELSPIDTDYSVGVGEFKTSGIAKNSDNSDRSLAKTNRLSEKGMNPVKMMFPGESYRIVRNSLIKSSLAKETITAKLEWNNGNVYRVSSDYMVVQYTYDSKLNPYKDIFGLYIEDIFLDNMILSKNNVIEERSYYDDDDNDVNAYIYEYNENNYPIEKKRLGSSYTVYYEYE